MPKIVIDEIASGYSLSKINEQFNKIETYINDKVLSRDSDGNANAMSEDLDMNSNQILNLPTPESPTDPVRLQDIPNLVTAAQGANYVGESAPVSAFNGMRWYNPTIPVTYVYYTDGDSGQWVEEANQAVDGGLRADLSAVGSLVPIAGVEASRLAKAITFNSVAEMVAASLLLGQSVKTLGFYSAGDGGAAEYIIGAGSSAEPLGSPNVAGGKYAALQIKNNKPSFKQYGVKDDPTGVFAAENTQRIQAALNAGGGVQGIPRATYYLTKEITVGAYTTYYAKQALHKQSPSWVYSGTSYTTVIVLGDASSTTGANLERCNVVGARVEESFLGDPTVSADLDNPLNYTSKAQYGIRAQRTNNSYARRCTVSGMATSGVGAEWSNDFVYDTLSISKSRFHGIANQGGTAAASRHRVMNCNIESVGGMAFDINTAAGSCVWLENNNCRYVRQFYKSTNGYAFSSNNECHSFNEVDNVFSAYGNSAGINSVNDRFYNFARLTASGTIGANYQWDNLTYISSNGSLLTVFENTTYKISNSVINITTDKNIPMINHASSGAKSGFNLSITDCELEFNTTAATNSASFGVISLAGWKNANINISNNKKFVCTGLSSQRIIVGIASDVTSTSGLAVIDGCNIESTGYDAQLGLFLSNAHNCRFVNNNIKGVAVGSYESTEDAAINFIQHSNFSDVNFTVALGSANRIYDYLAVGRSGASAPSGVKTPKRVGERYFHTTLGDFYQAYGLNNTDWRKLN